MHGPSPKLRDELGRLGRGRDVDRLGTRRRVRRLAGSLPVDDGLWLDALHAEGRLTEFQCDALRTGRPDAVRVGGWVPGEPLGGRGSRTWVARPERGGAAVALKRIAISGDPGRVTGTVRQLAKHGSNQSRGAAAVVPDRVERHGTELLLISRLVRGETWADRLARLGRFDAADLVAAAARLAAGLAELEGDGVVHGDVRAGNVRVDRRGRAVLVDAGCAAVLPGDVHAVDPERTHGVAPEAAVPGAGVTTAADLYSFGCLLWRAAAGQPVFPRATAAAVRVAHRTRPVPPLGDVCPDLPEPFLAAVDRCTRLDPADRPGSFAAAAELFADAARATPAGTRRVGRRTVLAAGLLLAASAGAVRFRATPDTSAVTAAAEDGVDLPNPLPAPDRSGRVLLRGGVRYAGAALPTAPVLHVECADAAPAEVVVTDRPFVLKAAAVHLRNVRVVAGGTGSPSLAAVVADRCTFDRVSLDGGAGVPVGLAVRPDGGTAVAELTVRDSFITGCETGVLGDRAACTFEQTAVTDATRAVSLRADGTAAVTLRRCTLRAAGPAVTVEGDVDPLHVTLDRCVLSRTEDGTTKGGAAVELHAAATPRQILIGGGDTVLDGYERPVGPGEDEEPSVDWDLELAGVRAASVTFADDGPAGVHVARIAGPRRAGVEVGCDADRLPVACGFAATPAQPRTIGRDEAAGGGRSRPD